MSAADPHHATHRTIEGVWRIGVMARFFALVLASSGTSFNRFRLVMREVYFSGVLPSGGRTSRCSPGK